MGEQDHIVSDDEKIAFDTETEILHIHGDKIKVKRKTKDSVFLNLFRDKKYLLMLYQVLHPEDANATEDSLDIVTIENVLTDNIYNDLGILVRHDRMLILAEAQSTWSENILIRVLLYLARSYQDFFGKTNQSLYRQKKLKAPKPEIYVIYTGDREARPEVLSFSKEFFNDADVDIEIKAKVIYQRNTEDIIDQYILFCKVFDEQRKLYGYNKAAIKNTIRICKDRNILRDYLDSRETEVISIMTSLYDQDEIMRVFLADYGNERKKEADMSTATRMFARGMKTEEVIDCLPGLSPEEIESAKAEAGIQQ
jgi:hypothetical protein